MSDWGNSNQNANNEPNWEYIADQFRGAQSNVEPTQSGWAIVHPWAVETIVAIGQLANTTTNPGLIVNHTLKLVGGNANNELANTDNVSVSVLLITSKGVVVNDANSANVKLLMIGVGGANAANLTLAYDPALSNPAGGELVFSGVLDLADYEPADILRINATSTITGIAGGTIRVEEVAGDHTRDGGFKREPDVHGCCRSVMKPFRRFLAEAFPPPKSKGPSKPAPGGKKPPFGGKKAGGDDSGGDDLAALNGAAGGGPNEGGDDGSEAMIAMQQQQQERERIEAEAHKAKEEEEARERQKIKKMRAEADADVADALDHKFNDQDDEVVFYPSIDGTDTLTDHLDKSMEKDGKKKKDEESDDEEDAETDSDESDDADKEADAKDDKKPAFDKKDKKSDDKKADKEPDKKKDKKKD